MSIKAKVVGALSLNMLLWLSMFLLLAGILCCAAGIYFLLVPPLGQAYAALIVGGGLIGLILLLVLIGVISQKSKKPSTAQKLRRNPEMVLENQLRPIIGDKATDWARQNTGIALVGALSAGVLLAASPKLRGLIYDSARPLVTRKLFQALQGFSDN